MDTTTSLSFPVFLQEADTNLIQPFSMNFSETLGSFGVGILLIAFILNLLKIIRTDSVIYGLLNLAGAGIACYASYLIPYFPFVILEGVWTVLSLVALVKTISRIPQSANRPPEGAD
ncbi:MAG TPA: hypothetical protein VGM24_06875 [Puia sp.]|jgi:hypothetical protein